jgi:hypothetical protein
MKITRVKVWFALAVAGAGAATAGICGVAMGQVAATRPATMEGTRAVLKATEGKVEMPVTKVVLFSSGVGYFEHNGMVEGTVSADLRFETAQINDVLKSLVVYDHGGGSVRTITYPANDPINRTLRSFQVNLSGDPPLAEILKQIRGAAVELSVGDERIAWGWSSGRRRWGRGRRRSRRMRGW